MRALKKGELIVVTHGEYSDFSLDGVMRVKKTFHPADMLRKARNESPNVFTKFSINSEPFLAWLSHMGFIEDVAHAKLSLGGYQIGDEGFEVIG